MNRRFLIILILTCLVVSGLASALAFPVGADDGVFHTVQWGDTLSGIAWRYRVKVADIVDANDLTNANAIYAGQKLRIPIEAGAYTEHVVASGETLLTIAHKYGVSYWDIMLRNGLANPNAIVAGQKLAIPAEGSETVAPAGETPAADTTPAPATETKATTLPVTEGLDPLCVLQEEIVIVSPLPEEQITSPVTVTGCTRGCCALAVDIIDALGVTIGQGYVLVDTPEGVWGHFGGTIEFTKPAEQQLGRIQVYRISERDGAIEHLSSVPVVLMP